MRKQESLKKNFIMNAILTMSQFIFPLITFPYVSRVLLAEGTGKVAFATSLIFYFNMFAHLGIPVYGIRMCAKIRDNREEFSKTVQELLIINGITTVFSYIVLAIVLMTVQRLQEERILYIVVSFTILFSYIGVEWVYKALEQYSYITVRSIICKFIAVVLMFLLIRDKNDYVIYGGLTIFAASASNVLNFIKLRKVINFKLCREYDLKRHLKPIWIFFAMSCATTIYTNLDSLMLGFMKADVDVGYYSAAVKIKSILVSVVTSLGAVLLPRSSYYIKNDLVDEFNKITSKAIRFVIIVSLPLMLYFIIFAEQGINFLSGEGYVGAIIPMMIIMPTLFFIGLSNILGMQILVPLGKEKQVLYSEIVGATIDLILNCIFIPKFGAAGAALGTVVAEVAVLSYQVGATRKLSASVLKKVKWMKYVISLAMGAVCSVWVINLYLSNFATLCISAVCFFSTYLVVLLLLKESMARELFDMLVLKVSRIRGKKIH